MIRHRIPRQGKTIADLASRTGLSKRTITRYTSEPREEYLARVAEKKALARDLRERGFSIREIARQTGCSKSAVHRYISES